MNYTEKFFMGILRGFVTGEYEEYDLSKVDRERLFALAKHQGVAGIVNHALKHGGLFEGEELREKLSEESEKQISLMALRNLRAECLSRELHLEGISHLVFKGPAVARYYPEPEFRTYGDVDIIIHRESRNQVVALLEKKGFEHYISDGGVVDNFKRGHEFYEIHSSLNVPEEIAAVFSEIWENAVPFSESSLCFEDNFHLSYLISHIEKHLHSGGAGVKMYLDIAFYLRNCPSLDLEKVRKKMTLCKIEGFFHTVLYLCHRGFDTPLPEFVKPMDEDVFEKLCEFTLSGGTFGDKSKAASLQNTLAQELSENKKGARARVILGRIFPAKTELWRIYPSFEGKNLLVPVAWAYHVLCFFTKGKFKNVREVMAVDVDGALEKNEFLKSIGCR